MADIELVIKIPEGLKNDFESEQWTALSCMEMKDALMNGTPIPDNATNADVIRALFPDGIPKDIVWTLQGDKRSKLVERTISERR